MNSERLLCSQKAGIKCSYKSFLIYKKIASMERTQVLTTKKLDTQNFKKEHYPNLEKHH